MIARNQRPALIAAIRRKFPDAKTEYSDIPWLRVPEINRSNGPLQKIFQALQAYRGHAAFATPGRRLVCDIVIPSQQLIVEYDERQHFSAPRAISLRLYPKDMPLCFNREEWIAHCDAIAAKDNDLRYRDEQRAFYDSVRDILAAINGYRVARLKHGAINWETCNADEEIMRRLSIRHTTPDPLVPSLVTVCIQGRPARQYRTNESRLELLAHVVGEIDTKKWKNLDAVVFPGGFLRLDESIGHLSHHDRVTARSIGLGIRPLAG